MSCLEQSDLLLGVLLLPSQYVSAAENKSTIHQVVEELELTESEKQKTLEITKEVKRLNSLTEEERNAEISKTLAEAEGQEFYFGEQTSTLGTYSVASTNAKIVNGGFNFFAYNQAGVNSLANSLATCATATGGITFIAGLIAKFAPTISSKIAASLLTGFGGFVTVRFADGAKIARSKTNKAGVRITVTETLDITSMGIDAYAR